MRRKLWLSKSKPGNIKQNIEAWRFFKTGLIKDKQYPYLGASPDRIQVCNCCAKTLLEVTSIFGRRNLQLYVAAAHCLDEVAAKYYVKKETSWN